MQSIQIEKTTINGIDVIKSSEWDGEILKMSRETFDKHSNHSFLDRVGVYIIYADHYDRMRYGNEIYVGQGDDVRQRLSEHLGKKLFWNKVLIFTSEKMNVAIAFNIEKEFIFRAKLANKYTVINGDSGQSKKLGHDDIEYMKNYINHSMQALSLAGNDTFTVNIDGLYVNESYGTYGAVTLVEGELNKIRILKGSKFLYLRDKGSFDKLRDSGFVEEVDDEVEFLEDYVTTIQEGGLPFLIDGSIYLSKFANSCGVKLSKAISSQKNG